MKLRIPLCLILLFSATIFSQETIRIPDVALEEALIDLEIDTNGLNGTILVSDARYVVNLNIEDPENNKLLPNVHSKIKDLTGIEKFTNLKRLVCYGNDISKIDVSKNTELTFLNCSQNNIKKLDVRNNSKLFFLSCDSNKLSSLQLGEKPELSELYANSNNLSKLDLKGCTTLNSIDVSSNKLTEILISNATANKIPEGWYKDASTTYVTTPGIELKATEQPVATEQTIATITEKAPEIKSYDENYKKTLVKEYEESVLNNAYLLKKKAELQKKYNININELSSWIAQYSKLKPATSSENDTYEFNDK